MDKYIVSDLIMETADVFGMKKAAAESGAVYSEEHFVKYSLQKQENTVLLRYYTTEDAYLNFIIDGCTKKVFLPAAEELSTVLVPLGEHHDFSVLEIVFLVVVVNFS